MKNSSSQNVPNKYSFIIVFLSIACLGFLLYSPSLRGEFVSDDFPTIVDNPAIRNVFDIPYIWQSFNTRFLTGLTFALNYHLDGLNPLGFHIINVLLHILVSLCVYIFARVVLRTPFLKHFFSDSAVGWISFVASLLFLVHPVQTQAVSFITQRAVSLATLFYISTLIFYIQGRITGKNQYTFIAMGCMFLGLLSKEMLLTVPLALLLCERFFWQQTWRESFKCVGIFFSAWMVLPLILWCNETSSVLDLKDQLTGQQFSWPYFLTEINVLRTYWRLFFVPIQLTHDYHYPISQTLLEIPVLFSVVWHVACLSLAVRLFHKARLISFCILWFYLTTSIEVMVVSIVNRKVIFEHWMYLPMVGLSIGCAYAMYRWIAQERLRKTSAVLMIAMLSLLTVTRNQVWAKEIYFWVDNVAKTPLNPHAYLGLAKAYDRKDMIPQAVFYYEKALSLEPRLKPALNNLGYISVQLGKKQQARGYFEKILLLDPQDAKAYNNLAYMDYLAGNHQEAVQNYEKSLHYQPPYPDGYFYAGQAYQALGHKEKARAYLQKARDLYQKQSDSTSARKAETLLTEIR
jgi:hypothetical protein